MASIRPRPGFDADDVPDADDEFGAGADKTAHGSGRVDLDEAGKGDLGGGHAADDPTDASGVAGARMGDAVQDADGDAPTGGLMNVGDGDDDPFDAASALSGDDTVPKADLGGDHPAEDVDDELDDLDD